VFCYSMLIVKSVLFIKGSHRPQNELICKLVVFYRLLLIVSMKYITGFTNDIIH